MRKSTAPQIIIVFLSNFRFGRFFLNYCICTVCGDTWFKIYRKKVKTLSGSHPTKKPVRGIGIKINKLIDELPVWDESKNSKKKIFVCKECLDNPERLYRIKKKIQSDPKKRTFVRDEHVELVAELLEKGKERN